MAAIATKGYMGVVSWVKNPRLKEKGLKRAWLDLGGFKQE